MQGTVCAHEGPVWSRVSGEWRPLYGNYRDTGLSVEWHDFRCEEPFDWSRSFHPDSLEICINFEGRGTIRERSDRTTVVNPRTVAHYSVNSRGLRAERHPSQRHRFLTIEMSRDWLGRVVAGHETGLHRQAREFLDHSCGGAAAREFPLDERVRRSAEEMVSRPVEGPGAGFWFHAKAVEITAQALASPAPELFCKRHQRVSLERVERVKQVLAKDLENPPNLTELGREVGCSPFYLSRIFSEQTGMTISRYLRAQRLEKAAELLRSGRCNVTEAAMAVGYSSLSHFSKAFAEMFGACPCVFPLAAKPRQ